MNANTFFILILLALNHVLGYSQTFTPQTVPNLKIQNNSYVSDPSNILDVETYNQINTDLLRIEDSTGSEIALVLLPSIGEVIPKDFAYELFNLWGIGKKGSDNGLLILFVLDQKRVEFETGNGIEAVLPDAICKRIITNELIPSFKQNAYGEGLVKGIAAINAILTNPNSAIEYVDPPQNEGSSFFLKAYTFFTSVLNGLVLFFLGKSQKKNETPYKKYHTLQKYANLFPFAFVFPIPFLGILWYVRKQMKIMRDTPPEEAHGIPLRRENLEDAKAKLNSGQLKEAELGVAEYDVWVGEGVNPTILRYLKSAGKYSKCNSCKFQTEKLTNTTTLRAATYSYSGEELLQYTCLHCGNKREKINIIPKKVRSSSSGSSGGSGGSSGGSWGGGRSSGGGAGGSW